MTSELIMSAVLWNDFDYFLMGYEKDDNDQWVKPVKSDVQKESNTKQKVVSKKIKNDEVDIKLVIVKPNTQPNAIRKK